MSAKHLKRSALLALILVAIAIVTLTAATFAWFTSNQSVGTSVARIRTGDEAVELQVSSTGGADFRGSGECDIVQVGSGNSTLLLPVSTADLSTFVTTTAFADDYASAFSVLEGESCYYHGRIYLRAVSDSVRDGSQLALYLDQREGLLARKDGDDSLLLNAARLGLRCSAAADRPIIFRLSENSNAAEDQARNTRLNGVVLEDGMVLDGRGGTVRAVTDPAVPLSRHTIGDTAGTQVGEPICYLDFGTIYALDVYFYLEGCDPDCSDSIQFNGSELHLAFYGAVR